MLNGVNCKTHKTNVYFSKLTKYSGKSTVISNQSKGKIIFGNFDITPISGMGSSSKFT